MENKKRTIRVIVFILLIMCLSIPVSAAPKQVGVVKFTCGVVAAGPEGKETRFLGKDEPIYEGDVITTGKKSFAIVHMMDDSKITIRPKTVFSVEEYQDERGKERGIFRLFKGGLRAVAGLIAKRNPKHGFFLHTPTAVVGIRGTEFDARLCEEGDCAEEAEAAGQVGEVAHTPVIARVFKLEGLLKARHEDAEERQLIKGGPIYEGDTLEMGPDGFAIVVFRDGSRISLTAGSVFSVDEYRFVEEKKSKAFFRLIKGGLKIFTGLISKRDKNALRLRTPTAVVGIRGTGLDALHREEGTYFNVWDGSIELTLESDASCGGLSLGQDQTAFWPVGTCEPVRLPQIPVFMKEMGVERPTMDVGEDLFSAKDTKEFPAGLYVTVYEGHVNLQNDAGSIDIGGGEAAYVEANDVMPVRLEQMPAFQLYDQYPTPQRLDEAEERVFELLVDEFSGPGIDKECECEIR